MDLEFKGLITKPELEKNISKLDNIIRENEYAIIIDDGVGKYVVFDIDFVRNNLKLINSNQSKERKSNLTLVESMIKALEELPTKKTTAKELSFLVESYYGKRSTPVTIRTRAEENANNRGIVNYFTIEPGNTIGLADGINYDVYIHNKIKRSVEIKLDKIFEGERGITLNQALHEVGLILKSSSFYDYTKDYTNKDYKRIILSLNKYEIDDNYLYVKSS